MMLISTSKVQMYFNQHRRKLSYCCAIRPSDAERFRKMDEKDFREILIEKNREFLEKFPEMRGLKFREDTIDEFIRIDQMFKPPLSAKERIQIRKRFGEFMKASNCEQFLDALVAILERKGAL